MVSDLCSLCQIDPGCQDIHKRPGLTELTLAFDWTVLYGNIAFAIVVL